MRERRVCFFFSFLSWILDELNCSVLIGSAQRPSTMANAPTSAGRGRPNDEHESDDEEEPVSTTVAERDPSNCVEPGNASHFGQFTWTVALPAAPADKDLLADISKIRQFRYTYAGDPCPVVLLSPHLPQPSRSAAQRDGAKARSEVGQRVRAPGPSRVLTFAHVVAATSSRSGALNGS